MQETTNETLKMTEPERAVRVHRSYKTVPAGNVFAFAMSGTRYLKMADGSIRRVDKPLSKKKRQKLLREGKGN